MNLILTSLLTQFLGDHYFIYLVWRQKVIDLYMVAYFKVAHVHRLTTGDFFFFSYCSAGEGHMERVWVLEASHYGHCSTFAKPLMYMDLI